MEIAKKEKAFQEAWAYLPSASPEPLSSEEGKEVVAYLNEHHGDDLIAYAAQWSHLGEEMRTANAFSGGSMVLEAANAVSVCSEEGDRAGGELKLCCSVRRRGFFGKIVITEEMTTVPLIMEDDLERSVGFSRMSAVDLQRTLMKMSIRVKRGASTASLIRMPVGGALATLPENLWLNGVPNSRFTRQYFYNRVTEAVESTLCLPHDSLVRQRAQITVLQPELNPAMDCYRIGTLLEMVREVATTLANRGLRVRICVQGPMGRGIFVGMPLSLNGVRKILELMDWQSESGEANEGMVGEGSYVQFGEVGPDEVKDYDDVYLMIAPQNIVGFSLVSLLEEMVEKADGRPMILINPRLDDIPSAEGTMSVRGRSERLAFAESFTPIYDFRCLYPRPSVYYPITGAVCRMGPEDVWMVYRHEGGQRSDVHNHDVYTPIGAFLNSPSDAEVNSILRDASSL